ncbi:hypothetical protein P152DRAFT_473767 [Eremomyces bilateralis CBS 781.70]|uniref:K Homology domain-containing protein n=1 Tax=Eremomyces bilateralis CBS 781.70 TaxID=1392243 RepID=A0A6G1G3J5_9PEZI|nr:uncharacterized protein P152DRAFT_473767 [Eremomyces bilateralis CBS 781.70]KAF1812623.1 hypothetical protein P152DRAFT_473767 [Eremomyces bilateralis CBS 781.70]
MAGQPDISSILAALAAQQPSAPQGQPGQPGQPLQNPQTQQPGPSGYGLPNPGAGGYGLPPPTNTGALDLSAIKPVNSGSVSIADAIAKARGIAAEKGLAYDSGRASTGPRSYRRSRSRSRTPPRQSFRDNYNPYRDERRGGDRRDPYPRRDRSRSPPGRGRENFSPPGRSYGHRDRDDGRADDNSEVIVIDSTLVGLVIGRQGENLRRVEAETGARIQFLTGPESAGPRRQCRISGTPRQRQDATREIDRIIEESPQGGGKPREPRGEPAREMPRAQPQVSKGLPQPLREGEKSIQIMVPDRTVGLIIGRGGETIRDLQDRSACHVNILGEDKSVNGLRPVNLIGNAESAQKAQDLIMEIVDSDTRNLSQGGQPPRDTGRIGHDLQDSTGKVNETIQIPSEAVGMVIGKGGETIKEMQNSTGCKINVTQPSGADIEREIGLVGSMQAIEAAKNAIWEKVDAVREKNGGGGGGGRRSGRPPSDHFDAYSQPQQSQQQSYAQPEAGYMMPQQAQAAPAGMPSADPASDPYAAWGGIQNYYQMYYAYQAQAAQQGQLPGQTPGQDQTKPPGTA